MGTVSITPDRDPDGDLADAEYARRYLAAERTTLDLRVRHYFRDRGWITRHNDSTELGEMWFFPGSFGGRQLNSINDLHTGGIGPLEIGVEASAPAVVRVLGCGVYAGCPQHRCVERQLPFDAALAGHLDEFEQHARTVDAPDLALCFLFGPCGRRGRERPW